MLTTFATAYIPTTLGPLKITATQRGIVAVTFAESLESSDDDVPDSLRQCLREFDEYFSGARRAFSVPLVMRSTDFQQMVWDALLEVPFGTTVTYGDLAERVGHPGAARAVGNAVHDNPLAIIVPCHRVLPAAGGIGQYVSGVHRKEWLLEHEKKHIKRP